jgi:hypothetical protein
MKTKWNKYKEGKGLINLQTMKNFLASIKTDMDNFNRIYSICFTPRFEHVNRILRLNYMIHMLDEYIRLFLETKQQEVITLLSSDDFNVSYWVDIFVNMIIDFFTEMAQIPRQYMCQVKPMMMNKIKGIIIVEFGRFLRELPPAQGGGNHRYKKRTSIISKASRRYRRRTTKQKRTRMRTRNHSRTRTRTKNRKHN